MSYHVTILRTQGSQRIPIRREELMAAVAAGQELKIDKSTETSLQIATINDSAEAPILIWERGEIWAKNPDARTLQLMINLATPLKARVRGDEFETYITPEQTQIHPDDERAIDAAKRETVNVVRRTKRRQWVLYAAIIAAFVVAGLLVSYFSRS